ncbi:hypothetical protein GH714_025134 [Hevea brasiliensis]|uniref:Golgi SNAP receptor complex member 1 n=1 Tax=Hevea brasiliensis TaxID=3981 RepID=A0A6A6LM26_HEVBR|nr:hypothetical protein GH714_025134 [Hevea brasiliensis]
MQARKLEAQLDEQMNSYRKLVSAKASTKVDAAENGLESGLDRLLKQLQQVNSQMQAWVSSGGSEMVSHTLIRHQEILQDLTQEFHRLRASLRAKQEHASLLEDFREFDRTRLDLEGGVGSTEQALLKEHASISRSTGQTDNVISQAQATLGALVLQRSTFGGINSKLSNVSSRLPTDSIIVVGTYCSLLEFSNSIFVECQHLKIMESTLVLASAKDQSYDDPPPEREEKENGIESDIEVERSCHLQVAIDKV